MAVGEDGMVGWFPSDPFLVPAGAV